MSWEISTDTCILTRVKGTARGKMLRNTGAQPGAGVTEGEGRGQDGGSRGSGCMYTHG